MLSRCRPDVSTLAKKKGSGGGKGGKQPKVSALDKLMKAKEEAPKVESGTEGSTAEHNSPEVMMLLLVLASSYTQATKKFLMEDVDFEQLAAELFNAPFALIVHDKYSDADAAVITYANKAALSLLGGEWADVVGSSSSQFAPADKDSFLGPQFEAKPLAAVVETWLKSASGKLLKVKDGLIFDVSSMADQKLGQAIKFSTVENEAGQVVVLDPAEAAALEQLKVPTEEDVAQAQAAVDEQAAVVRELKEGKGLTNRDQEVKDAVAELLKRKEHASQLQKRLSLVE